MLDMDYLKWISSSGCRSQVAMWLQTQSLGLYIFTENFDTFRDARSSLENLPLSISPESSDLGLISSLHIKKWTDIHSPSASINFLYTLPFKYLVNRAKAVDNEVLTGWLSMKETDVYSIRERLCIIRRVLCEILPQRTRFTTWGEMCSCLYIHWGHCETVKETGAVKLLSFTAIDSRSWIKFDVQLRTWMFSLKFEPRRTLASLSN